MSVDPANQTLTAIIQRIIPFPVTVCFVELQAFTEEVLRVADEETLRQFQAELAAHPEAGEVIRHSGGLRKVRMKLPGRGRSSGARVIYLWLPEARRFVLFMLYTKAKQTDIPPALLAEYREVIGIIRSWKVRPPRSWRSVGA